MVIHINSLDKSITPSLQCQLTRDGKFLLGHCAVPFVPVIVACCDIELDRLICLIGGSLAVEYHEITAFALYLAFDCFPGLHPYIKTSNPPEEATKGVGL